LTKPAESEEHLGKGKYEPTDLERARDELFSHIRRCGVLEAEDGQREEWMQDTVEFLAERYPNLSRQELGELKKIGDRYCRPAIPHGEADARDAWEEVETDEVTAA